MTERREQFNAIANRLQSTSDLELSALLAQATHLGASIGGAQSLIEVAGARVFVKKIPLTEIEKDAAGMETTANLFDLPLGCHFGVGSPGFGVWREVAANEIATALVLDGSLECFAAMYHYRVMAGPPSDEPMSEELQDIDAFVRHWHGSEAVRRRAHAIAAANAHVVLFLEYIPDTVPRWLDARVNEGPDATGRAIELVERCLVRDVPRMNAAGLFHFDAHFDNLLTDGTQVYFVDFGLATSPTFDLSAEEREFLARTTSHDTAHTVTRLVDWLVTEFADPPTWRERDAIIQEVATTGSCVVEMNPSARRLVERYAPVAAAVNEFYQQLHTQDRTASFPTEEVLDACVRSDLVVPTNV